MFGNSDNNSTARTWASLLRFGVQSAILAIGLTVVLTFQILPGRYQFHEGDVVTFNIKSPSKVSYVSQLSTKTERDRAASAVQEVTEFDPGIANQQLLKADDVLRQISDIRRQGSPTEDKLRALNAVQPLNLDNGAARQALLMNDPQWLLTTVEIKRVLSVAMNERFTQEQMRDLARRVPSMVDPLLPPERKALVAETATALLRPTILVDSEATNAAREAARASVQPVRVNVEKGEIILRDGDVVKPLDIEKLEWVGLTNPSVNWNDVAGNAILATAFALILSVYTYLFLPATWASSRRLSLVYAVILVSLLAAKLTIPGRDLWAYLFPVAAVPMLLATLLDVHLAMVAIGIFAPMIGLVSGGSLELATASLVGGMVGLLGVHRMERQATAILAGVGVGLATFATVASFKLWTQDTEITQIGLIGLICLVNGGLSTVVTLGTSSILGHIFGVTTTPGLLELAHPSQPLFRRLLTQAPGTYHHSVVVANLAERAAQQIGADSLLTRVGAYYHDIGKVARPYCFVENQLDGQNIHDKLNPQMSAKLISAHVKDGLQLAQQSGLPSKVRDIIEQHHGTKLAKYFYHQACKDGGCEGDLKEDDFRYPGPRPQTKEAALVLLADAVEAAVRASDDHSAEGIARVVARLINETVIDGQLDESDLSLRDLQVVREAFVSVLQGIFHPRIKYPEPAEAEELNAGSLVPAAIPSMNSSEQPTVEEPAPQEKAVGAGEEH